MSNADCNSGDKTHLPLELRCALDLIARETVAPDGTIRGDLIGSPVLIAALEGYAAVSASPDVLIALMESADTVTEALANNPARDVWMLTAGPLHRILRPLRARSAGCVPAVGGMSDQRWAELGYKRSSAFGIQGFGSIAWAIGERLCRKTGRPDLADRCRIGMLRTLVTARLLNLGAVQVHQYRRESRGQ